MEGSRGQKKEKKDRSMLERLFFRLLPVQVMIVAMGSVNSIADGVTAARCLGAKAVAVIGLYYSFMRVMEAVSAVLTGGSTVLCGRYLGSGQIDRTRGVFSLDIAITVITGGLLTAVSFLVPSALAGALGADASLRQDLTRYITGYAFGILPQILAQQLAGFLQLERENRRCYLGIAVMIMTNVTLDLAFMEGLHMGAFGLALASSVANWAYLFILAPYYFTRRAQLKFSMGKVRCGELKSLLTIGFPGALLIFCLALRSLVINHTLQIYSGSDGLSAMSSFNMLSGLILAIAIGAGAVVRILTSICVGEKDPDNVISLFRIVITRVLPLSAAAGVGLFFLAPWIAGVFYTDHTSAVFDLTRQLFAVYSICIPMVLLCQVSTNYFQAIGRVGFVHFLSIFDGFFSMVIPAVLLAPHLGAGGVWLALPIGIFATMEMGPLYCIFSCRGLPHGISQWLLLPQVFPEKDRFFRYSSSLHDPAQVTEVSGLLYEFCQEHGMEDRTAYHTALCFEEMAKNIFQHGFSADRRHHTVDLCMVIMEESVQLRIKDDCIPFNPEEFAGMTTKPDPGKNIGIRMVFGIASEIIYQNLTGLNVLTIRVNRHL